MTDTIELDPNFSTTRRVIKTDPQQMAEVVKQSNKPEDKFETVLFLSEGEGRQGEGGLRTKGYFKQTQDDKSLITVVTVVTVVYNGEQFLEETILSVINQTYDNVEYIIIDGGSTDGTLDIIRKYEHAIDYWVSEKDKGIYDAMNKGIDLATGEWINFMNSGDGFYQSSVLTEVFVEKFYQDVQILYGNHQVIYPSCRKRLVNAGLVKNLWKGSQFCHQASFIKTGYHRKETFNIAAKFVADFNFFYKAWKKGIKFKHVKKIICYVRADGVSDKNRFEVFRQWVDVIKVEDGKLELKVTVYFISKYCTEIFKRSLKWFIQLK